jgi:type IV pilus assembly protein PilQ
MYQDKDMKTRSSILRGPWLVAIVLLGLAAGLTVAAEAPAPAVDPDAAMGSETIDPNQAQVDFSNGCLIKFIAFQKDSNIRDGLRLLAVLCKKNIVPSSRVDGPLTVSRLYNVTFEQALKSILGYGFRYEQEGDFIKVYTAEEYKQIKEDPERRVHKVITLYYVTADEAQKLVKPVLSEKAIVAVSSASENKISGASSGGGTTTGLTVSGGADDPANNDMIVVFDYPENIEKAEALLREVDIRPKQVLVEATILSARLTDTTQFGIDWNLLSGQFVTGYPSTIGGSGTPVETYGFAQNPATAKGLVAGISANNVQVIITALEEITDTTVLANPKILAVNKQEGQVLIGKKLGYLDTTTQTQTSTTQSVKFLNTGTQLVFRPYIGDDGYIRMQIYPKDSDGVVKDNGIPDETTTELCTNVVVKDGETIVIGGLFRDSVVTSRSQVPVLGSLPFVGVAFRGTKDTVTREEVIIMLTPHIIKDAAETNPEKRAKDLRLKRESAVDSLQIIDASRIAEETYAAAARSYLEGDVEQALCNLRITLQMRPTYLEALRLRERIIAETDPEQLKRLDSMVEQEVGKQDAEGWMRR